MTPVEFARRKVEYDRKVNQVIVVVFWVTFVAGVVLSVIALFKQGIVKALGGLSIVAFVWYALHLTKARVEDADAVLPELRQAEADPEHGMDNLSEEAYAYVRMSPKELRGQFFAYLALALTLVVFGAFMLALGLGGSELLTFVGVVFAVGAVLLLFLTISCGRIWWLSKQVERT